MIDLDLVDIEYSGPEVDAQIAAIRERVDRTGWPCFFDPRRRIQKMLIGHRYPPPVFPKTFKCGVCERDDKRMGSSSLIIDGKPAYCCSECLGALADRWGMR